MLTHQEVLGLRDLPLSLFELKLHSSFPPTNRIIEHGISLGERQQFIFTSYIFEHHIGKYLRNRARSCKLLFLLQSTFLLTVAHKSC
jgi:hypothetical protein